jgi:hypothetical protein
MTRPTAPLLSSPFTKSNTSAISESTRPTQSSQCNAWPQTPDTNPTALRSSPGPSLVSSNSRPPSAGSHQVKASQPLRRAKAAAKKATRPDSDNTPSPPAQKTNSDPQREKKQSPDDKNAGGWRLAANRHTWPSRLLQTGRSPFIGLHLTRA